jgi:hypothetical protein
VDEADEIKLLQRGRMLCAMQAWWTIWGYQNYPATSPSARLIKAKLPAMVRDLAYDKKVCDLAIYFGRPKVDEMRDLKYTEFFSKYDYAMKLPARVSKSTLVSYEVSFFGKVFHIYPTKGGRHIVRMGFLPFNSGEIFWLRLLLYKVPAFSYVELRTVGEQVCSSFQQAALVRRLADEEATATDMFNECIIFQSPHELRVLFANMTLEGFPTVHIYNSEDVQSMYDDYLKPGISECLAINKMLLALAKLFKLQANKLLSDYGLPEPQEQETELQIERLMYDCEEQVKLVASLLTANPLTDEMQQLFDVVKQVRRYMLCGITL